MSSGEFFPLIPYQISRKANHISCASTSIHTSTQKRRQKHKNKSAFAHAAGAVVFRAENRPIKDKVRCNSICLQKFANFPRSFKMHKSKLVCTF